MAVSSTGLLRPSAILAYVGVAKPRGILPHLITAAAGAVLASSGSPEPARLASTLVGGACLAASANAFNSYLDRDIDALMVRTSHRPLPSRQIAPGQALLFGVAVGLGGVAILSLFVNWQAATLAVVALFYYAAYTLFLKRRSYWAAVIGSGVGAMPPMIGWVAFTHRIEITPFILSGIVVLWTLPHFWALATFRRADFERAGLKVMPGRGAGWWIVVSSVLLIAASLLLVPTGGMGNGYLATASTLGLVLLALASSMLRKDPSRAASRLYRYSVFYMASLFLVMIADKIVF